MKVSILVLAYNHEKFIAQAIESALMQQVDFEYEIVIGEDCSPDSTRQIAISYQEKYPDKIRLLLPEKNLGMHKNFAQTLQACQGQYIAMLEGDDYWTVPDKLKKQVDYLDARPECAICCHDTLAVWEERNYAPARCLNNYKEISTLEDLLLVNFIPTPSVMYRGGLVSELPNWLDKLSMGDWSFHILNAQHGYIGYINEVMAAYRIHSGGVWSSKSPKWQLQETIKALEAFKIHLDPKYDFILNLALADKHERLSRWYKLEAEKIQNDLTNSLKENFQLRDINLITFPDWSQPEELVCQNLERVIRSIFIYPEPSKITLLIENSNTFDEVDMIISAIIMDLIQEDIDISEEPAISFTGELNQMQWKLLLPQVNARIALKNENKQAIIKVGAENIPVVEIEGLDTNKFNRRLPKNTKLDELRKEALALDEYECYEEAEQKYKKLLKEDGNQPEVLFNLGMVYYKTNQYQQALDLLLKSSELEPLKALNHYGIGLALEKLGRIPQAIRAYEQAIAQDSVWIDPYNNLGNIFLKAGELEQAELIYRAAIAANSSHFGSYINLGNILMERRQINEAIETYKKALDLNPSHPDILHNLGVASNANQDSVQAAFYYGYAYYYQGQYQQAIRQFEQLIKREIGDANLYLALADCYRNLNQYEETIETYQSGIKHYPKVDNLHFFLALTLQEFGCTEEVIKVATEALEFIPNSVALKLVQRIMLPIIYETEAEINFYRSKFIQGLQELVEQLSLDTVEARKQYLIGIGSYTNFYLQYQGKNDVELQKQYGQFVHQIMAANYPQWVMPLSMRSLGKYEKIRVGYISSYFRNHNGAKWALGWLQNHNRQDFKIYCYYTGSILDQVTQKFDSLCDVMHHMPDDLEAVCSQIVADKLHILVFPDIGMSPPTTQIAGLRLAPVQCTAWGHPVTSGLPTIDYYLSSNLMEPENAQEHYTEQLVRLPNLGFSYIKPVIPQPTKTCSDFQLRDDALVYLSSQSLFKYLPQFDYIFVAIVQQVPQSQIAFLSHPSRYIVEKFRQRLKRTFAKFNLNSEDYCVIVPRQDTVGYFNLNLVSDVFIDTFTWNGGNTTLEAIACNLPVVTCPGEFMRGRHSCAILEMLGVTDTIASSEAEYIEIAVRLGLDRKWRDSITLRMKERYSYLYDDKTCVAALDAFYRRVVAEDLSLKSH